MAKLLHLPTGESRRLSGRSLVGRSSSCQLQLQQPTASAEHAVVSFDGQRWWLRDLSSRNGTWIDQERVPPGTQRPLHPGQRLGFGAPQAQWLFACDRAPQPRATGPQGQIVEAENHLLVLPSPEAPTVMVFRGQGGRWMAETDTDFTAVADGDTLLVQEQAFVLELPTPLPGTAAPAEPMVSLDQVRLAFRVTQDEEYVELSLSHPVGTTALPPRAHQYLLLLLARARTRDAHLPASSQGWVYRDELMRDLRLDDNALNVAVHRARKQFASAEISEAARIIERRIQTGQLRIGVCDSRVYSL